MRTERPPELWEADTQNEVFLPMLGEMIALGLGRGNPLADLTLSISNMTVEPEEDPDEEHEWIQEGDYVAVTVKGPGTWADGTWRAGRGPAKGLLSNVVPAAETAGAVFAYTRDLGAEGSVTVFLPRLEESGTT